MTGAPFDDTVGARQLVDCTPGRPFVKPRVRRTAAVQGMPRSCWLTALGVDDQLGEKPGTEAHPWELRAFPIWSLT
jgi:hypothetical protein